MPIYELDDDTFNGLDDEVKQKFQTYQPEDTAGLKNKANQILGEKKDLESEIAQLKADAKKAKPSGASDEKLADAMAQLEAANSTISTMNKNAGESRLMAEATKLAGELTKDSRRQAMLAKEFKGRLQLDNNQITVLDANGNQTISTTAELVKWGREEFDFLADAPASSGGGATGGSGRAAEAKTIKRADFDAMSHHARSEFFTSGGSIAD